MRISWIFPSQISHKMRFLSIKVEQIVAKRKGRGPFGPISASPAVFARIAVVRWTKKAAKPI
jgi:hypothetical protein